MRTAMPVHHPFLPTAAAVLALVAGVVPFNAATAAGDAVPAPALRWDLTLPVYDPPTCPAWARVPVPDWLKPYQGKNGLPEPWHSRPGSTCGGAVAGIDRYQANLYVVYRPETAVYLYSAYTPAKAAYVRGTLPGYERVVAKYTKPKMSQTEKALALLTVAMPAVFRHPGVLPVFGGDIRPNRNLMDEALLASGGGWCNEQGRVFIRLCQVAGMQGRILHLFGQSHTTSEIYVDGRWVLADASYLFVARDKKGNLLSAAACHDRGPGQRAYARARARRLQQLLKMTPAQANLSPAELETVRKWMRAFDADELAKSTDLHFAVINYPLPTDAATEPLSASETARRELNVKFDKLNLRQKHAFVVDRSEEFIKLPKAELAGEFTAWRSRRTAPLSPSWITAPSGGAAARSATPR